MSTVPFTFAAAFARQARESLQQKRAAEQPDQSLADFEAEEDGLNPESPQAPLVEGGGPPELRPRRS